MAENLDDGEFWLPPHFLTDDYSPMNNNGAKNVKVFNSQNFDVLSALFHSELSSSDESVVWSSQTDSSDEDYHMANLTHRMTHQLDFDLSQNYKSPNSVYHLNTHRATWDLLHAAAGEVEKMKLFVPPKKSSPVTQISQQQGMVWSGTNTTTQLKGYSGNYNNQWGQSNQMVENRVRNIDSGLSSYALEQYECGMRAMNLVNPSVKRESIGTGVFLPRNVGHCPVIKSKKKPASKTVSVPTRMVNAKDSKQHRQRSNEALFIDYESAFPKIQSNYGISQQKRNQKHKPPRVNHETQLPQEWTY
ncbi:hypothetical protein Lal_00011204 [Lupinus albus]|uniref:Uncharacterized protein n=1 Tax=Lupinus albus TaxID=3870 RepID=A0A6A5NVD2_LUPAL|nr:hypothetical protein Lalb_Chr13g0291891 [Lupinus albus]KAF1888433.1 hypothetical protein Lal_00011204 [Lupinus albus]